MNVGRINFGAARSMSELRRYTAQAPVDAAHEIRRLQRELEVAVGRVVGCVALEQAARRAERRVHEALMELAIWCPHGFDSARSADYDVAERLRRPLREAHNELKAGLGVRDVSPAAEEQQ